MSTSRYPEGWDEERVRRLLAFYDSQTEEEAVAEDEAAWEARRQAFIQVPVELLPAVQDLIARWQAGHPGR